MSANELLQEIEALPEDQRRWLIDKLYQKAEREGADWANFSALQLAHQYAAEDSIYDQE